MKRKTRYVLFSILAILAFATIFWLWAVNLAKTSYITLYEFRDAYPASTQVTGDMLQPFTVSKDVYADTGEPISNRYLTPANYAYLLEQQDNYLATSVVKGEPVMVAFLTSSTQLQMESSMGSQSVALTLSVNNEKGVTPQLKSGCFVNITGTKDNRTTLLAEKVKILQVVSSGGSISTVTVECTTKELYLKLSNAKENESLSFGLVSGTQYREGDQKGYTYDAQTGAYSYEDAVSEEEDHQVLMPYVDSSSLDEGRLSGIDSELSDDLLEGRAE